MPRVCKRIQCGHLICSFTYFSALMSITTSFFVYHSLETQKLNIARYYSSRLATSLCISQDLSFHYRFTWFNIRSLAKFTVILHCPEIPLRDTQTSVRSINPLCHNGSRRRNGMRMSSNKETFIRLALYFRITTSPFARRSLSRAKVLPSLHHDTHDAV